MVCAGKVSVAEKLWLLPQYRRVAKNDSGEVASRVIIHDLYGVGSHPRIGNRHNSSLVVAMCYSRHKSKNIRISLKLTWWVGVLHSRDFSSWAPKGGLR